MKIFFHGKLAEDYGSEHVIMCSNVADGVEGLTRQIGFYSDRQVEDRPVVVIVGCDTEESLLETRDEIHIIPAVYGGSGLGKVLLGAALIGLSFIPGLGQIGTVAVSSILMGAGVSLVMGGLMEMFIKAPSLSKSTDPEASKYLGLSNNTVKLGTLRSYSMGRVLLTAPHLLALNVDASDLVTGEFPA